jgi:hypothetical protein
MKGIVANSLFYGFVTVAFVAVILAELVIGIPFIATGVAIAVLLVTLMFSWPKVWIAASILVLPLFLTESGEGISIFELAIGGSLILSISFWVLWRLATNYPSILRTWPDVAILLWLALSSLNIVVALLNGIDVISWLSEWSLFVLILYYLPIREYFGATESGRMNILTIIAFGSVIQALHSIWLFKQRMDTVLIYAFQVQAARSVLLGPLFLVVIIGCLIAYHSIESRRGRLLCIVAIVVNSAALFLTFTRTLWLLGALSIVLAMLFLNIRQITATITSVFGVVLAGISAAFATVPRLAEVLVTIVKHRVLSSTTLRGGDFSFETRLIEAAATWRSILELPMGGQGIRYSILRWDPIYQMSVNTTFVHIGYLGLIMKLGFPLALFLIGVLTTFLIRGVYDVFSHRHTLLLSPSLRIMGVTLVAFVPTFYVVIFMSGVFDQRYGVFLIAFLFAMSAILRDQLTQPSPRSLALA